MRFRLCEFGWISSVFVYLSLRVRVKTCTPTRCYHHIEYTHVKVYKMRMQLCSRTEYDIFFISCGERYTGKQSRLYDSNFQSNIQSVNNDRLQLLCLAFCHESLIIK